MSSSYGIKNSTSIVNDHPCLLWGNHLPRSHACWYSPSPAVLMCYSPDTDKETKLRQIPIFCQASHEGELWNWFAASELSLTCCCYILFSQVPSTHIRRFTTIQNSSSKGANSSGLLGHCTHMYTYRLNNRKNKNECRLFLTGWWNTVYLYML